MRSFSAARIVLIAVFFALLGGSSGCKRELNSICEAELPEFEQKMQSAELALAPWFEEGPKPSGRKIASSANKLSSADLQSWKSWSSSKIRLIHRLMENFAEMHLSLGQQKRDSIQSALVGLESEIVYFVGYLENQQFGRAQLAINRAVKHSSVLRLQVCQVQEGNAP